VESIGVLNPGGAFTLAAVAALIVLHLRLRRRRTIPVSTLFLWRQIPTQVLGRRRFLRTLLFVLQLGVLLALIAGYLRPYRARGGVAAQPSLLLVLDASASMQAREAGGTRFELARRRARDLVGRLGPGGTTMIVVAAGGAHVALGWTADDTRVQRRLEELEPLDTPTNLAPALRLGLGEVRGHAGARLAVLTDLPPDGILVSPAELAAIDWIQIGETDDNLALTGLTLEEPAFATLHDATATVVVRNYAARERHARLEARAGSEPWATRELTLPPRGSEHVRLGAPPAAGLVEVSLDAGDALPVDDRAVGWLAPAAPLDVLVVTDSDELAADLSRLAPALDGSRIDTISRARWDGDPPPGYATVLFDGFVPERQRPVNALYVAPPPGNPLCPSIGTAVDASVIDWESGHPALAGLDDLNALADTPAIQLETPPWGTALVYAAARGVGFPFLIAGERDGRRVACLGAALTPPLASSDRIPLLVLTLSALRWLSAPADTTLTVLTAVATQAPAGTPAGAGPGIRFTSGDPPVVVAERAGVHRLVGSRLVLANLFDDRESDIGRTGARERPATASVAGVTSATRHELGWWLYLAAAALLVLESLAWRREERA
jgi:von Willebrand factor type A domain/Aerotolerance regulator N-terminal